MQQRGWSRRKAGVPIVEKNADRVIGLIHHGKVRLCVAIQIAGGDRHRAIARRYGRTGSFRKGAVTMPQKNGHVVGGLIYDG